MNNDILVLLATGAVVLTALTSAAGCAKRAANIPQPAPVTAVIETEPVTPAVEDAEAAAKLEAQASHVFAHNPVMDYTGDYYNNKTTLLVEADGEEKAMLTVVLANGKNTQTIFTANTKFDEETNSLVYTNGTKKLVKLDKDGNVISEKEIYSNDTGRFVLGAKKAVWTDSNEQVSNLVFAFGTPENSTSSVRV